MSERVSERERERLGASTRGSERKSVSVQCQQLLTQQKAGQRRAKCTSISVRGGAVVMCVGLCRSEQRVDTSEEEDAEEERGGR